MSGNRAISRIPYFIAITIILTVNVNFAQNFTEQQKKFPRVREAFEEKLPSVQKFFAAKNMAYPPHSILIRCFKDEKKMELWARARKEDKFIKIKRYSICSLSGQPGPKRQQGDLQVPEGFYFINRFNPKSAFHLSLGLNYPNQSDRILGNKKNLGGDIFIHGGCVTIGCIPITNDKIKELYIIAVDAKSNGQKRIPVHIFPKQMNTFRYVNLKKRFKYNEELLSFWENLKQGYDLFEKTQRLPRITVDNKGRYIFTKQ